MGKRFASFYGCLAFARFWKVKFWRSFIVNISMTVGRIFTKIYIVISLSWAFFRKPEKLGSHTGSKWWPGDPDVKDDSNDPLTRWPNDPVSCLVAKCKRTLSDLIQQDFKSRRSCCISNEIQVDFVFDNCVSRHRLNLKHCMINDRAKYLSQMSSRLKVIVKAWLHRTLDMKMK